MIIYSGKKKKELTGQIIKQIQIWQRLYKTAVLYPFPVLEMHFQSIEEPLKYIQLQRILLMDKHVREG